MRPESGHTEAIGATMLTRTLTRALALAATAFALAAAPAGAAGVKSIVGGTTAPPGSWPSIVFIFVDYGDNKGISCDGTVIAPQWVVTAAHCGVDIRKRDLPNYQPEQYTLLAKTHTAVVEGAEVLQV